MSFRQYVPGFLSIVSLHTFPIIAYSCATCAEIKRRELAETYGESAASIHPTTLNFTGHAAAICDSHTPVNQSANQE